MTEIGRPSLFDSELCEQAHNYCLLGATNDQLAEFFAVSPRTVDYDRTVERMAVVAGELRPVTSTIHYPANVQACIFWLRNRRRQTWGDAFNEPRPNTVDDIALLEAAAESVRHHDGD
jgi:hypothetical protein